MGHCENLWPLYLGNWESKDMSPSWVGEMMFVPFWKSAMSSSSHHCSRDWGEHWLRPPVPVSHAWPRKSGLFRKYWKMGSPASWYLLSHPLIWPPPSFGWPRTGNWRRQWASAASKSLLKSSVLTETSNTSSRSTSGYWARTKLAQMQPQRSELEDCG